jgi:tetratricopeptide (TPR) repeat protein
MKLALRSIAVAVLLSTSVASAANKTPTPDEVERGRTFFNAGAMAYAAGKYFDAVRSFEQAYDLAPRPQVLFSLAQAERKEYFASNNAAYLRRAIQHYKEYLEQVPTGGRRSEATEAKADLEGRLARLDPAQAQGSLAPVEKRKARITVYSATPGAQVVVDNGQPQELPYFADLEPGKHVVRVFAEGYFDAQQEVSGDKPIDVPLNLTLRDRPALVTVSYDGAADFYVDGRIAATTPVARAIEVSPGTHVLSLSANGKKAYSQEVVLERGKPFKLEPRPEASGQRVVAWTMLIGGGVGLLGGGFFGLAALGRENRVQELDQIRTERNITAAELAEHNRAIESRDTFRTTAIVSTAVGGALAAGGLLLYVFDKPNVAVLPPRSVEPGPSPKKPGELEITAQPMLGPGIYGGGATVRF